MKQNLYTVLDDLSYLEKRLNKKYNSLIRYDKIPSFLEGSPTDILKVITTDIKQAKVKRLRYFKNTKDIMIVLDASI